jgi:hypothetical protein
MKITTMLLFATFSWAAPNPDEYSINVHVSSSRWVVEPTVVTTPQACQKLDVIIDGKKYELETFSYGNLVAGVPLLALGDYKAKLVRDQHKVTYESSQIYEFMFPDKKTMKFTVVGQSE